MASIGDVVLERLRNAPERLRDAAEYAREWVYIHWTLWMTLAAVALGVIVWNLMEMKHGVYIYTKLYWVSFPMMSHFMFILYVTGKSGRRYNQPILKFVYHFLGKTLIQAVGVAFGVVVKEIVTYNRITTDFLLLVTAYAFLASQWLKFLVKLEMTMVWVSTTAILAWNRTQGDYIANHSAMRVSAWLLGFLTIANFLDAFVPEDDEDTHEIAIKGRESLLGNDSDYFTPPSSPPRPRRRQIRGPPGPGRGNGKRNIVDTENPRPSNGGGGQGSTTAADGGNGSDHHDVENPRPSNGGGGQAGTSSGGGGDGKVPRTKSESSIRKGGAFFGNVPRNRSGINIRKS